MHFTSVFLLFEEKSDQEKKCICLHQSQSHFQQQQQKKVLFGHKRLDKKIKEHVRPTAHQPAD
jgi:hypothetical protein